MSHLFGKHSFLGHGVGGGLIGDLLGGIAGFALGGPVGAAIGAGIGGAGGSAVTGGKPLQDVISGLSGAALGYGGAELAGAAGLGGAATDVATGAATGAGAAETGVAAGVDSFGAQAANDAINGLGYGAVTGASGGAVPATQVAAELSATPVAASGVSAGQITPGFLSTFDTPTQTANIFAPVTGQTAAVAGQAPGAAVGGAGTASPSILSQIGGALSGTTAKTVGEVVSGLGLAKNLVTATHDNPIKGMGNLQQIARTSATQGQVLQQYLTTGTLPPAIQASVDRATQDAITTVKSKYASMGVAPGSTQELAEIANLQQEAVIKGATLADQLYQQGVSQVGMASSIYNELVGTNTELNKQTNSAIGNLASALAGGGKVVVQSGTQAP
jgi:hypothetical protein